MFFSATSGIIISGLPSIDMVNSPYFLFDIIGAEIGFIYWIELFISCIWSKDKVEIIFFDEIKFIFGSTPNQTSTFFIIWPSSTKVFWDVWLKAQLIKLIDSFNLDLELFVPLITIVILLLSRLAVAAIPHPDFFVKPVFNPSAPGTWYKSLFLFGWVISLYVNSFISKYE